MKITRVSYQKAFVIGPYLQERVGFEAEIDDAEDEAKALSKLKEIAEQWHIANNPQVHASENSLNPYGPEQSWAIPASIQVEKNEPAIGIKPEDILSCNDLKVLETYKFLVKKDKELERAYMEQYERLSKSI